MIIQCGPGVIACAPSVDEIPSAVPLARGIVFAVREWVRFCERNVREGRARYDDGKIHYERSWVPRYQVEQYYVSEQRQREVERAAR